VTAGGNASLLAVEGFIINRRIFTGDAAMHFACVATSARRREKLQMSIMPIHFVCASIGDCDVTGSWEMSSEVDGQGSLEEKTSERAMRAQNKSSGRSICSMTRIWLARWLAFHRNPSPPARNFLRRQRWTTSFVVKNKPPNVCGVYYSRLCHHHHLPVLTACIPDGQQHSRKIPRPSPFTCYRLTMAFDQRVTGEQRRKNKAHLY
jgi:hypothetical protein